MAIPRMGLKDETRHFSLITRRAREVVLKLKSTDTYSVDEIATIICEVDKNSEFYLKARDRQMSKNSAARYIRFLINIGIFARGDNRYQLNFLPRDTDDAWAQAFSDQSVRYLRIILAAPKKPEMSTDKVPQLLKSKVKELLKDSELPTLDNIVDKFPHLESERQKDFFKWAVYLYTDSKYCPLDMFRSPILMER